jgi:hypothetical protein
MNVKIVGDILVDSRGSELLEVLLAEANSAAIS